MRKNKLLSIIICTALLCGAFMDILPAFTYSVSAEEAPLAEQTTVPTLGIAADETLPPEGETLPEAPEETEAPEPTETPQPAIEPTDTPPPEVEPTETPLPEVEQTEAAPEETGVPDVEPTTVEITQVPELPEETPPPEAAETIPPEEETPEPVQPGDMALGDGASISAMPGEVITLAVPVVYEDSQGEYASNANGAGSTIPYSDENKPADYDQALTQEVDMLSVAIATDQPKDCPIAPEAFGQRDSIISGGENTGYAAFTDLKVLEDAAPGVHTVDLSVNWKETGEEKVRTKRFSVDVEVLEAPIMRALTAEQINESVSPGTYYISVVPNGATTDGTETVTIAIPITYTQTHMVYDEALDDFVPSDQVDYDTNADTNAPGDSKNIIPYGGGGSFDQATITTVLSSLSVALTAPTGGDVTPINLVTYPPSVSIISGGANSGYAVFENIPVAAGLQEGQYTLPIQVNYQSVGGEAKSQALSVSVSIAASSAPVLFGENGVIAFNHAQLKQALQNTIPGYEGHAFDPVYLGYCETDMPPTSWEQRNDGVITYPTGNAAIEVKRSVTIIGTDPRNKRKLNVVDRPTAYADGVSSSLCGIYMNQNGILVTVRDVSWDGNNGNGVVMGNAASGVQFVNVSYKGSRMFATSTANCWASFTGCNIRITDMTARAQELAYGGDIRFYGSNTIVRDGYASGVYHAILWVNVAPHKVTIASGANVSIDTNRYFIHDSVSSSLSVDVSGKLDLTTRGDAGCMTYEGYYIENLSVSGTLNIKHYGNSSAAVRNQSLRVDNLTVTGVLDIENTVNNSNAQCINMYSTKAALFDSPKFVRLRTANSGSVLDSTSRYNIKNVGAINRTATNGTKYVWNNQGVDDQRFSASYIGTTFSTDLSNAYNGIAIGAVALNRANFSPQTATTEIMFGQYGKFNVDDIYTGLLDVTGSAPSGANLTVTERSGATWATVVQSKPATSSGGYQATFDAEIQADTRVYAQSIRNNGFEAYTYATRVEPPVTFTVPPLMDFGTVQVSGNRQEIYLNDSSWTVEVNDLRSVGNWTLKAHVTPYQRTGDSAPLAAKIMYKSPGDSTVKDLSSDVVIATKVAGDPPHRQITWADGTGFFTDIDPFAGESGSQYTATVLWTLEID